MPEYSKTSKHGKISGYIPDYPGENAELYILVVEEGQTGCGEGTLLLNAFEIEARIAGAEKIEGTLGSHYTKYTNPNKLRAFYKRHGYNVIEREGKNPRIEKVLTDP